MKGPEIGVPQSSCINHTHDSIPRLSSLGSFSFFLSFISTCLQYLQCTVILGSGYLVSSTNVNIIRHKHDLRLIISVQALLRQVTNLEAPVKPSKGRVISAFYCLAQSFKVILPTPHQPTTLFSNCLYQFFPNHSTQFSQKQHFFFLNSYFIRLPNADQNYVIITTRKFGIRNLKMTQPIIFKMEFYITRPSQSYIPSPFKL